MKITYIKRLITQYPSKLLYPKHKSIKTGKNHKTKKININKRRKEKYLGVVNLKNIRKTPKKNQLKEVINHSNFSFELNFNG